MPSQATDQGLNEERQKQLNAQLLLLIPAIAVPPVLAAAYEFYKFCYLSEQESAQATPTATIFQLSFAASIFLKSITTILQWYNIPQDVALRISAILVPPITTGLNALVQRTDISSFNAWGLTFAASATYSVAYKLAGKILPNPFSKNTVSTEEQKEKVQKNQNRTFFGFA